MDIGSSFESLSTPLIADADGVLFVALDRTADVLQAASAIRSTEARQARSVSAGTSLREQLGFREYLERRSREPDYSFRSHLRSIGGAIEE